MTVDTTEKDALAALAAFVVEATREQFSALGLQPVERSAAKAIGEASSDDFAVIVSFAAPGVRGSLVLKVGAKVARHGGTGDLHDRVAELGGGLAARVATRCLARALDLQIGVPVVLSGVGIAIRHSPAGGRLGFDSSAGPIDVVFDVAISEGLSRFRECTILVIDDSPAVRQEVVTLLVDKGYRVLEAADGLEGLDRVAGHPELAMVFCDLNMPRMDGLAFVEKMKDGGAHAALPIVMLTSETRVKLCGQALKRGAAGWIVKPFKAEEVMATVEKLTRRAGVGQTG